MIIRWLSPHRSKAFCKKIGIITAVLCCAAWVTSCAKREVTLSSEDPPAVQSVSAPAVTEAQITPEKFYVDITMTGGSGKAGILSPVEITRENGMMTAALIWSSKNYDHMRVDGVRYDNENPGGASTFHIPVGSLEEPLTVIGDTVAMSTPHEIEYVINWGEQHAAVPQTGEDEEETGEPDLDAGERSSNTGPDPAVEQALEDAGLIRTGELPLRYATGFSVTEYGDYARIFIPDSGEYLLIPEGGQAPDGLPEDVVLLKKPLDHTYLVSTAAMDLISCCGALPMIRLSGTKETDWYIGEASRTMRNGDILYAGKYSAPDYERILQEGCRLAVENTMIYHQPAVKAKLEELGIPVLVETSSYEKHPLGRLEWIKLYGILYDRADEAQQYFDEQAGRFEALAADTDDTGLTVAFFHVTAAGMINVRKSGDYITTMIGLAGGHYALSNAGESDNALSTMNMQMEDFYAQARDADILIYNSTIGGEISSIRELTDKNPLFADFKAVKEGEVYCTERSLFQQISGMAEFMQDLHELFRHGERNYTYLNRLE